MTDERQKFRGNVRRSRYEQFASSLRHIVRDMNERRYRISATRICEPKRYSVIIRYRVFVDNRSSLSSIILYSYRKVPKYTNVPPNQRVRYLFIH